MNGQCIIIEKIPLNETRYRVEIVDFDKTRTISSLDKLSRHNALLVAKSMQNGTKLAVREKSGNDLYKLPNSELLDYGILFN